MGLSEKMIRGAAAAELIQLRSPLAPTHRGAMAGTVTKMPVLLVHQGDGSAAPLIHLATP